MTQDAPILAICLAPTSIDVVPHSYVLHIHSQQCSCGSLHEWSQVYAKTHLRSRTGAGKYVVNLRPLDRPDFNLPTETLRREPQRIPFCHECLSADTLKHLPRPAMPENLSPAPTAKPGPNAKRGNAASAKGGLSAGLSAIDLMESL